MGRPRIYPVQELDGISFFRKPAGYYKADHKLGGFYMHRYVWERVNGPIPPGMAVHHKDHDRANNAIDNLALLTASEHASLHSRKRMVPGSPEVAAHMARIRPKASEWHRSEEGLAWHREHGKRVAAGLRKEIRICVVCGRDYEGTVGFAKSGYCGGTCQNRARRARLGHL